MNWSHGPFGRWEDRLPRERRHEPFTPRVPAFFSSHPGWSGLLLAVGSIGCFLWINSRLADWPPWLLLPGSMAAIVCIIFMMLGLGLVTIRALYPVLAVMDLEWDAEPLAALGIPLPLQRKCEQLGFWAAEDVVKAVERGKFPWVELEYDERMQVERAAHRWSRAAEAERAHKRANRRGVWRRAPRGENAAD